MNVGLMSGSNVETNRSIIAPGSSTVELTDREWEVAMLIGTGYSYKRTGSMLGIATGTVSKYVSDIAARIPGDGKPNLKVAAFIRERLG